MHRLTLAESRAAEVRLRRELARCPACLRAEIEGALRVQRLVSARLI